MIEVRRYNPDLKVEWDSFLDQAKNGSFLFKRDYIEYHADRFEDYSLVVIENNKIHSVFPLSIKNNVLTSHAGLTYGGVVLQASGKVLDVLRIFYCIFKYLNDQGFERIIYKSIPSFYHLQPSYEEQYVLFLMEAKLLRRDAGSVLDLTDRLPYQERRSRSIKKAKKNNIEIITNGSLEQFWNNVLIPNLLSTHNLKPVHSLEEILRLHSIFPNNILQFNACIEGETIAGVTIFLNNKVVHAQYISANERGKEIGAIDLLFDNIINQTFSSMKYFSFGVSTEEAGLYLNKGLIEWKEGFGARTWCNDFYEINASYYINLKIFEQ